MCSRLSKSVKTKNLRIESKVSQKAQVEAAARFIISSSILDAYRRNINNAEDRFAKVITDIVPTPAQKDQEAKIARAEICSALQNIKDLNEGVLPDEDLETYWRQFRCDSFP